MTEATYYTFGKRWNGFLTFDGEVVPYKDIESFTSRHIDLTKGRGWKIGRIEHHVFLNGEYEISEHLRTQLWPDGKVD